MLLLVFLAGFLVLATTKHWKMVIGLAILGVACAIFFVKGLVGVPEHSENSPVRIETVHILYDDISKKPLLGNTAFLDMLKKKGIALNTTRLNPKDISAASREWADGIWFSGPVSADRFRAAHPDMKNPGGPVFHSMLVFYTWPEILELLEKQGIATKQDGGYRVSAPRRLLDIMIEGRPWAMMGLRELEGTAGFRAASPSGSESGLLAEYLAAVWLRDGKTVIAPDLPALLPDLKKIYAVMGTPEATAEDLFSRYIKQGEWAFPVILADENLCVALYQSLPAYREKIRDKVRVLVPEPTIRIDHPFIPLTEGGERLLKALLSPEIQTFIHENYGFRPETSLPEIPQVIHDLGRDTPDITSVAISAGAVEALSAAGPLP